MTVMQKMDVAAIEGSIGPRIIPVTPEGFPRNNLTTLFLFKETVSGAGFKDEVSGNFYPFSGTAAPQAGGGVQLSGNSMIVGPEFNIQARWTIMIGLTQPAQGTGLPARRTWASIGTWGLRGINVWINPNSGDDVSVNALHPLYARNMVSGAEAANWPGIQRPWVAQYGKPQTVVMRHHGGGNVSFQQRKGNAVRQASSVWDMDAITGPTGVKSALQALNIGAIAGYDGGSTIYDCAAIHTIRDLTEAEIRKFTAAHEALAATRGRS